MAKRIVERAGFLTYEPTEHSHVLRGSDGMFYWIDESGELSMPLTSIAAAYVALLDYIPYLEHGRDLVSE